MRTKETHLYVLALENDNYYVGITTRALDERLNEHSSGKGAAWTQEHATRGLYTKKENVQNPKAAERWVTLLCMRLFGWKNVRGGGWTRRDLPSKPSDLDRYTTKELKQKAKDAAL